MLAGLGYGLLIIAWVFTNPPSAAPDEPAHAVRAAAAGEGHWAGTAVRPFQRDTGLTAAQAQFLNDETQQFTISARLVPPAPCFEASADTTASCLDRSNGSVAGSATVSVTTPATTAPPFYYAVAGAAMRLDQTFLKPIYLGRLPLALLCALLLAGAAWAASRYSGLWQMAGLALAATPMVIFLASTLTLTGVAVCAAICFASAVFSACMERPGSGLLMLAGLSGFLLALTRPSALLYMAAIMLVALPLLRLGVLFRLGTFFALVLAGAGVALELNWNVNHQVPLPAGAGSITDSIPIVLQQVPDLAGQLVGVFGWTDVSLPLAMTMVWGGLALLLAAAALLIGLWRDRLAMLVAASLAVLMTAGAQAIVLSPVGWQLQGRYVLAAAALLPLLGGFVVQRAGILPRLDVSVIGLVVAGIQFAAFWLNAQRYAVGVSGPLNFVAAPQWSPPGGWTVWLVAAGLGAALVALSMGPLTAAEREDAADTGLVGDAGLISVSR